MYRMETSEIPSLRKQGKLNQRPYLKDNHISDVRAPSWRTAPDAGLWRGHTAGVRIHPGLVNLRRAVTDTVPCALCEPRGQERD